MELFLKIQLACMVGTAITLFYLEIKTGKYLDVGAKVLFIVLWPSVWVIWGLSDFMKWRDRKKSKKS